MIPIPTYMSGKRNHFGFILSCMISTILSQEKGTIYTVLNSRISTQSICIMLCGLGPVRAAI